MNSIYPCDYVIKIILMIVVATLVSCSKKRHKLLANLKSAQTFEQERRAAIEINNKDSPDRFVFLDENGNVYSPNDSDDLSKVYILRLFWDDDVDGYFDHKVISERNMRIIIGE